MNRLSIDKRQAVVASLVEGVSINSTARLTGVSKPTILKLLADFGCACARHHDATVRGLKPSRIECDEVWASNYCKQKNVGRAKAAPVAAGDCWTWTAIDPDTKLILSYFLGLRSGDDAKAFMLDLAGRVTNLTQITTDGLGVYPDAVWNAFEDRVHFAQLIKGYKAEPANEARYSPASCIGCKKTLVIDYPNRETVSTSMVQRHNLTIRMSMRRFTRLTNGHSKKIENHGHALAMFFAYYNFCRIHSTLRITPAMKAGLTDHVWTLGELIRLAD